MTLRRHARHPWRTTLPEARLLAFESQQPPDRATFEEPQPDRPDSHKWAPVRSGEFAAKVEADLPQLQQQLEGLRQRLSLLAGQQLQEAFALFMDIHMDTARTWYKGESLDPGFRQHWPAYATSLLTQLGLRYRVVLGADGLPTTDPPLPPSVTIRGKVYRLKTGGSPAAPGGEPQPVPPAGRGEPEPPPQRPRPPERPMETAADRVRRLRREAEKGHGADMQALWDRKKADIATLTPRTDAKNQSKVAEVVADRDAIEKMQMDVEQDRKKIAATIDAMKSSQRLKEAARARPDGIAAMLLAVLETTTIGVTNLYNLNVAFLPPDAFARLAGKTGINTASAELGVEVKNYKVTDVEKLKTRLEEMQASAQADAVRRMEGEEWVAATKRLTEQAAFFVAIAVDQMRDLQGAGSNIDRANAVLKLAKSAGKVQQQGIKLYLIDALREYNIELEKPFPDIGGNRHSVSLEESGSSWMLKSTVEKREDILRRTEGEKLLKDIRREGETWVYKVGGNKATFSFDSTIRKWTRSANCNGAVYPNQELVAPCTQRIEFGEDYGRLYDALATLNTR